KFYSVSSVLAQPLNRLLDPRHGFDEIFFTRRVGNAEMSAHAECAAGDGGDEGVFQQVIAEFIAGVDGFAGGGFFAEETLDVRENVECAFGFEAAYAGH